MITGGWLKMDLADKAPPLIDEEAWRQLRLGRERSAASETMMCTWLRARDTTSA
jgi:hypothetical protein